MNAYVLQLVGLGAPPDGCSLWISPTTGVEKLNVDVTCSSIRNKSGLGVVLRNEKGELCFAKFEDVQGVCDVLVAETMTLLYGLKEAD